MKEKLEIHGMTCTKGEIRRSVRALELEIKELDLLILKTPTGTKRNIMTDCSIMLVNAHLKLSGLCQRTGEDV